MAIPNPNPNIADGIKCDNKTYSSNKIESLISAATELPIPAEGDEGKVLTVNSDADGYELDTPVSASDVDTAIATALTPAAVVPTVPAGVAIEENTSYQIGNLVVLNMILKCTDTIANNGNILTGLPVSASTDRIIFIKRNGTDKWIQSTINGSFIILPESGDLVNVTAINGTEGSPVYVSVNITYIST